MTIRLTVAALAVASAFATPALAASPYDSPILLAAATPGEQPAVIVTATRQVQRADESLASVDIIDREEIERAGPGSALDLLARQAGVQIASNGGPGKTSSLYLRGANANHTILLIDGVRIGSVTSGQPTLENIPLSQIERIEILRGPASALYGADAVGGVIQVFTKRGEGPAQFEAFGGAGNLGTTQFGAGVSGSSGALSYALRAAEYETHGVSARKGPYPAMKSWHNYDPALDADRDGYRSRSLGGNLGYTLAPGHELRLNLVHIESRNWYDGGGYNSPAGGADVGNDALTQVIAVESINRITPIWQSTVRLAQAKDETRAFRAGSRFDSKQEQVLWQNDIKLPLGNLMLGYEHLEQQVDSTTSFTVKSRDISSFMAGWNAGLGNHQWQANLRHDSNSQFGDKLTHVLGYGYRITPALRASGSVGTSFKAPTLNDLYYVDSGGNHGDPNLKAEKGHNRELALRYDVAGTRASVTYFDNKIDNLITWAALPPTYAYVPLQTGEARIKGWELAYGALLGAYELSASIDLSDPRDESTDKQLARRAREAARVALSRSFGALSLGGELYATGKRYNDAANNEKLGGYSLVNLFAHYKVDRDWRLEARANNILDKDYELAKGYNTLGASVFVGVRYTPH
ncbi:TonB-dependent receptor domain-containing protein [Zoogloea sp.]|uniref:TonB-dependent receptor domain-containing protein n=1 Tax=Zoogloea sp. TaxID=49181 RepID=UPI0035B487E9